MIAFNSFEFVDHFLNSGSTQKMFVNFESIHNMQMQLPCHSSRYTQEIPCKTELVNQSENAVQSRNFWGTICSYGSSRPAQNLASWEKCNHWLFLDDLKKCTKCSHWWFTSIDLILSYPKSEKTRAIKREEVTPELLICLLKEKTMFHSEAKFDVRLPVSKFVAHSPKYNSTSHRMGLRYLLD